MKKVFQRTSLKLMAMTLALAFCLTVNVTPVQAASENDGFYNQCSQTLQQAYSKSYSGYEVFDPQKYIEPEKSYDDYPKDSHDVNTADYPIFTDPDKKDFFENHAPVNFRNSTNTVLGGIDSIVKDSGDIQTFEGMIFPVNKYQKSNTVTVWLDDSRLGMSIYTGNGDVIYKNVDETTHEKEQPPKNPIVSYSHQKSVQGKTAYYFEIDPNKVSTTDVASLMVYISIFPLKGAFESQTVPTSSYAVWSGTPVNMKYQASPIQLYSPSIVYPQKSAVIEMDNKYRLLPERGYIDRISINVNSESGDIEKIRSRSISYSKDGNYYNSLPVTVGSDVPAELRGKSFFKVNLNWQSSIKGNFYYSCVFAANIDVVVPLGV